MSEAYIFQQLCPDGDGDLFIFGGGETTKDFYPASDLLQSSSWFVIPHFPPTTSIKVVRAGAIKIGSRVEMDCE